MFSQILFLQPSPAGIYFMDVASIEIVGGSSLEHACFLVLRNDVKCVACQGLEVIEAHYLFGADYDDIDIVVHPQSIIHSMVETQVTLMFVM